MSVVRSLLSALIALSLLVLPAWSDEPPAPPSEAELAQTKAEADALAVQKDEQVTQVEAIQKRIQELQKQLFDQKKALAQAEEAVKKTDETLKPIQEAFVKAEGEAKPLVEALAAANKAAEDAKGTDDEKAKADEAAKAAEAAKPKQDALAQAQAALDKTNADIEAAKAKVAESPGLIAATEAEITAAQAQLAAAGQKRDEIDAQFVAKLKSYQHGMIAHGKLVSFAEKIAPIFAQRCLACHNARTAKGRYNMENFAAILKGGESGAAVEHGKADLSTLFIMIEDGSMPKDADPLTAEELALVKKWIDTGAELDAGVSVSAELITYMPKFPQPMPPESYRVAVPVTALAFSPDGAWLASSGYHEVILWNAENGQLARRITNLAERVYDLEFSPDGQTLAVAAGTPAQIGELKLFRVADGELLADLIRTGDSVFAAAFNADGSKLACACADRSIRVYDVASHKPLLTIEDHADWVIDVAWSPDGTKLASASRDKTSKVFDANTGDSLVTFNGHNNTVSGVAFKADGSQIITSGANRQLHVWNVADAKEIRKIGGFGDEIFRVIVSPENEVYSVSADKNARKHNVDNGQAVKTYSGHQDWIYSLARHAASKRIATGGYNGEVRVWNEDEAKTLLQWTAAPGHEAQQTAAP